MSCIEVGYQHAAVVASSNTATIPTTRALHIGTAGLITVQLRSGASVQLSAPAGVLPVYATKVYQTGTSATSIVALY